MQSTAGVTDENLLFFIERVNSTFALSENHKKQIIEQAPNIPFDEIDRILSIITNYERLILKDEVSGKEKLEMEEESKNIENIINDFNF